ncbi:MAG TPA: hypothetical protein VEI97_10755, partial [bacterium]|nr:hypothetical protein [bacterium]
ALDRAVGEGHILYTLVLLFLLIGAFLTPLYMTRQMAYVFWGTRYRGDENPDAHHAHGHGDHGEDPHAHHPAVVHPDDAHGMTTHEVVEDAEIQHRLEEDPHHAGHEAHDPHHGHGDHQPHEQPIVIWGPLVVLALFTIIIGWLYGAHGPFMTNTTVPALNHNAFGGVPSVFANAYYPKSFEAAHGHGAPHDGAGGGHIEEAHAEETHAAPTAPGLIKFQGATVEGASHAAHLNLEFLILGLAGLGVLIGWLVYGRDASVVFGKRREEFKATATGAGLFRLLNNKYYIDEIYQAYIITPFLVFTHLCRAFDTFVMDGIVNAAGLFWVGLTRVSRWLDTRIVDGMVNALAWLTQSTSRGLRFIQSGYVQNYFMVVVVMVLAWLWFSHSQQVRTAANAGQISPAEQLDRAAGIPPTTPGGIPPPPAAAE